MVYLPIILFIKFEEVIKLVKIFNRDPSVIILISMGNNPSQQNYDFLLDNFVKIREQNGLKVLQDSKTRESFVLRQICFVNRCEYDRNFRLLTQRDNSNSCENILQLVKLWSKQHNGVCSNLFKIYTVYQYPKVRLIEQIQARRKQSKYFEQIQLFNILQSCLNAYTAESAYINISPYIIFIIPEGILKLIHADLLDVNYRTTYTPHYYYSPEKINNFNNQNESPEDLQKQSIFSLGMTLLHAALLQSPSFCYQISSRRFNHRKLQILLSQLTSLYSKSACDLFNKMLEINPYDRLNIDEVQTMINDYFNNYHETMRNSQKISEVRQSIKYMNQEVVKNSEPSLYLNHQGMNQSQSVDLALHSNIKSIQSSEFHVNLVFSQSTEHLPKNHHVLLKSKKTQEKKVTNEINKENFSPESKRTDGVKCNLDKANQQSSHKSRVLTNRQTHHNIKIEQTGKSKSINKQSGYLGGQNNSKCTFMIQEYQDNTRYEGMVQNNKKNGYGKLIYPDGVFYQGTFKNDTLHGKGSLFYSKNRPAYVGDWTQNKFHGKGTLYNSSICFLKEGTFNFRDFNKLGDCWSKYEGNFFEDIKEGPGKIYLTTGETMQGNFQGGFLNGQGIFTKANGNKISGKWINNIYQSSVSL